jgi:hypothetical protein
LILDAPEYGRINFSESVNLSGGDIGSYVSVSFNRIEIDTVGLPALDGVATLRLYNLTFSNPRILRDDVICPISICSEVDYTGGTFEFNVTGFSVYSTEETPVSAGTVNPNTGGSVTTTPSGVSGATGLKAEPESFNIKKTVWIFDRRKIALSNLGSGELEVEVEVVGLEDIISFDDDKFVMGAREEREFVFDVDVPEKPGIYVGKLIFKSASDELIVPFILNAGSEKSLFDIGVDIPDEYRHIDEGDKLKAQITLLQAALQEQMDVTLDYVIKDYDGGIYLKESETVAVFEQKSYLKEFQVQDFEKGTYVLGATVTYSGGVATASSQFTVEKASLISGEVDYMMVGILVVLVAVFVFLVILITRYKKGLLKRKRKRGKNGK